MADVVEIIRQELADKGQRQGLAEAEISFVREREIFLPVVDVIGQFVVELFPVHEVGLIEDISGLFADEGAKLPHVAVGVGELDAVMMSWNFAGIGLGSKSPQLRPPQAAS
ncbi:hypothetical protein [Bradyrhizobium frederickii]|uniref:hypothetical protein n=1 Tax=Bradyrhizobium frederickii TaxID=2560054 RepID=UPI00142FC45F|nr:hypothetical protein [Bradyrhizobium frederickii]